MLRLIAVFAVLVNLLAGALPAGATLHVGRDGRIAIDGSSCCAMDPQSPDLALAHGASRAVHCCCFTGVVIGHGDIHSGSVPQGDLPVLPPVDAWWVSGLFEHARGADAGSVLWSRDRPPPSLGALRPDTVVIRC